MDILNYVKPELIVVALVLYIVGTALKKSEKVKDSTCSTARPIWRMF